MYRFFFGHFDSFGPQKKLNIHKKCEGIVLASVSYCAVHVTSFHIVVTLMSTQPEGMALGVSPGTACLQRRPNTRDDNYFTPRHLPFSNVMPFAGDIQPNMVKLSVITVICVCKKTPKTPKMGQFIYDLTIWLPFVVFLEHFARPLTKNNDMGNLKIRALTDSSLLCSASWDRAGFNETVAYTQLPITALGSLQTSTLSFAVCGFSTKKAKLKNTRKNMPVPFTQPHPTSVMSLMLA